MSPRHRIVVGLIAALIALAAVGLWATSAASRNIRCAEQQVRSLPLRGPLASPEAEISGLTWYGDDLVILPQYPDRVGGSLFALPREEIAAVLQGVPRPLEPRPIPFDAADIAQRTPGFEGFEAITFRGDRVFVTVEAGDGHGSRGFLYRGTVGTSLSSIRLDPASGVVLDSQTALPNLGYEALTSAGPQLVAVYEANGRVNRRPRAEVYDEGLVRRRPVPFAPLEFRVTDLSRADAGGRFWAINYFWEGSPWEAGPCALLDRFGVGPTHARSRTVERLVELRLGARGIEPTGRQPVLLRLRGDGKGRNWEGLARFGDGFVLATDEHPESMLAFVGAR